jgi:hypothetical protein
MLQQVPRVLLEQAGQRERPVPTEQWVQQVLPERQELMGLQALLVPREPPGQQELTVQSVQQVLPERQELMER